MMFEIHQSPTDPVFVQNPYPVYAKMRDAGDVVFWADYNMAAATSHKAVRAVLTDRRFGRTPPPKHAMTPQANIAAWQGIESHSMLELEPPTHTRLRGLVLRAFTSRRISGLVPQIEDVAAELIDDFPEGPFDILTHFAQPLPVRIIARLLGVDEAHAPDLLAWSNAMVAMYQASRTQATEDAAEKASTDFTEFLRDVIEVKRKANDTDLISDLIAARDNDDKLSEAELISTCILILNAGHEATVHTLGNGLLALSRANWPDITAEVVEEVLRHDPPLHMFTRWAYEDVEVCGTTIKKGSEIACLLASANHDPAAMDAADGFDKDRTTKANTHISFGAGIHFCVGAPLARMELVIALRMLMDRCPNLRITEAPVYGNTYHFHGLERLMVQVR